MAKTVIGATIDIDVKNSSKSIDELNKEIEQLNQTLNESQENSELYQNALKKIEQLEAELAKKTKELTKETKSAGEESKKTGGAFGKLGGFIKGLGVVAVATAAFGALREAFSRNQKSADTFSAVLLTIQAVFNKVVEVISEVISKVSDNTKGFEGLTNVLKGLVGLIGGNLKLAFSTIALIIQEAQLAWEQSFFGDKDPESIKKLNESIEQSKKSIKEAAKQSLEAGKLVITNIGNAASEVGQVVVGLVDEAQKIDGEFIKNTFNQSKALVELKNNAKIAAATLAGVRAEAEREAELLRQQRDDQNLSIEERIAANEKLSEVLEKQKIASIALANQNIAAAEAELAQNKGSVELRAAVIAAQNERKDIEAQIAGLYSEQKANVVALGTELKARDKAAIEGANAILFERKKANTEAIQDELKKNIELQKIRNEERNTELSRLRDNINNTAKGTQARVDAEIAYNQKKKELDLADQAAFIERVKIVRDRNLAENTARNENLLAEIAYRKQLNDQARIDAIDKTQTAIDLAKQETAALLEQLQIKRDAEIADAQAKGLSTIEIKKKYQLQEDAINNALAQSERDLAEAKVEAQLGAAQQISGILGGLRGLVGEETKAGKAIAIAQASIDTYQAAWSAFKNAQKNPISVIGPAYPYIQAALAVAGGIANIRKIVSVPVPGGGSGGSVPSLSAGAGAPTIPTAAPAVIAQAVNTQAINQLSNQGMRAYVLNSDIQNNEQRNAYLQRNARIG